MTWAAAEWPPLTLQEAGRTQKRNVRPFNRRSTAQHKEHMTYCLMSCLPIGVPQVCAGFIFSFISNEFSSRATFGIHPTVP